MCFNFVDICVTLSNDSVNHNSPNESNKKKSPHETHVKFEKHIELQLFSVEWHNERNSMKNNFNLYTVRLIFGFLMALNVPFLFRYILSLAETGSCIRFMYDELKVESIFECQSYRPSTIVNIDNYQSFPSNYDGKRHKQHNKIQIKCKISKACHFSSGLVLFV